jgi:uncharacterized membrane protein
VRALLQAGLTLATAAYPLVVYFGFGRWDPLWLALALAALLALRAWSGGDAVWLLAGVLALLLGATASLAGTWVPLKLYPVMVSAVLLAVFAASVLRPPTVVERIARLREPDLPPAGVAYTRRVTVAWCGFFVVNGLASAATAVWASEAVWLLYNGLIAYLLIAAFFAGEWLVRQRHLARRVSHG